MSTVYQAPSKRATRFLWIAQGILALLFLFGAGAKLTMPAATLAQMSHLPATFMRFISVCEALGAVGLILPGLLHVHEELTPLAAIGLVIIMIGAVAETAAHMGVAPAIMPLIVGLLALSVAWGRRYQLLSRASRPAPAWDASA